MEDMTRDIPGPALSEDERGRIRAEMRYAIVAAREAVGTTEKPKSSIDKALGYLSNGFVLLVIGATISSGLIPYFQRKYDNRRQQYVLMKECLSEFLLYSNSIWQEYYTILPLTQEVEINKSEYLKYTKRIAEIKLKRYDAYAKVQALSVVFRNKDDGTHNGVEVALKKYAVSLNTASTAIDKWLTALYCTPTMREDSPCATFDPDFDSFSEYENLTQLVVDVGNEESDNVAAIIVERMKEID